MKEGAENRGIPEEREDERERNRAGDTEGWKERKRAGRKKESGKESK